MNESVSPQDIKSGDTIILSHTSFVVRNVARMPLGAYWIFREPDGKLAFAIHAGETVMRRKVRRRPRKAKAA